MSKPTTYVNGRGETICTSCTKPVKGGYCECNRHGIRGKARIKLGSWIPQVGDEVELEYPDGRECRIKITKVRGVKWDMPKGKTPGIVIHYTYSFVDEMKEGNPRPKLTLIK